MGILNIIGIALLIYVFILYSSVIKKKNTLYEAFSSIDVQLKKRYDLIPNILSIAAKFLEHERELMKEISELRGKAMRLPADINQVKQKVQLDSKINSLLGQLQVTTENYPQLKSDKAMLTAMQTYNATEERIAAARRFYNSAVKDLNNAVEIFPSSLIAAMIGIKKAEFIKAEDYERQTINADIIQ